MNGLKPIVRPALVFSAVMSGVFGFVATRASLARAEDGPMSVDPASQSPGGGAGGKGAGESKGDSEELVGADACINEEVRADLFAKRQRRDVRDRLFLQTNRHEITVLGGYYASDLFDGSGIVGLAYAYHMTEDFAVEASAALSRVGSTSSPELERKFVLLGRRDRRAMLFDADLVWSPAHAKLRLGGAIAHFDLYAALGAGLVDSPFASDIAANAAVGFKFFMGRAFAVRLDIRNHAYRQQLLAETEWVNDVTAMLGVSLFLPVVE